MPRLKEITFGLEMKVAVEKYEPLTLLAEQTWELETGSAEEVQKTMQMAKIGLIKQMEQLSEVNFQTRVKGLNFEVKQKWKEPTQQQAQEAYRGM